MVATILTCLTGFGIFQHGGFGKPHVLGIATLAVLALAAMAGRSTVFGAASRAAVETSTRLPSGAPLVADREAPALQMATRLLFIVFLVGATLQVRRLRAASARP